LDVGEAFLNHPLPHDRIRPAAGYKPLDQQALFIPRLKELSQDRLKESKDFSYIVQDVMKAKERIKLNQLSVKKTDRERELSESNAQQKERNAERRERFAKMTQADQKSLRFYKVTLDDIDAGAGVRAYNPADESGEYMRRAKDETADLDETPKWPTGLDPLKRESLNVLKDLVDLTENARLAGLLKGSAAIR
jgi:carboxyl-terminal processing protease